MNKFKAIKTAIQAVINLIIATLQPERIFLTHRSIKGDKIEYIALIIIPDICKTPNLELEPL